MKKKKANKPPKKNARPLDDAEKAKLMHEMVEHLWDKVCGMEKMMHFQAAQIQGLRIYAATKIGELNQQDSEAAYEELSEMVRVIYDHCISEVENESPSKAADLDVRSELFEGEELNRWYLASDRHSKKAEPDDSGKSDGK